MLNHVSRKCFLPIVCVGSLFAQIRPAEDHTSDRRISLNIVADVTYTARKMVFDFSDLYSVNGAGGVQQAQDALSSNIIQTYISSAAKDAFLQSQLYNTLSQTSVAQGLAPYMSYVSTTFAVIGAFTLAYEAYNAVITADHTKMRVYQFLAPTDGFYSFDIWIPGDWDKPASMIDINSITNSGAFVNRYHYDQTNVSDRVKHINAFCSSGINLIYVSVGSGSAMTHNAGNLNTVYLDDSVYRTWTAKEMPTASFEFKGIDYLSSIGSKFNKLLTYNPNFHPSNLQDGSVSYSNPHPKIIATDVKDVLDVKQVAIPNAPPGVLANYMLTGLALAFNNTMTFDGTTANISLTRPSNTTYSIHRVIVNGVTNL